MSPTHTMSAHLCKQIYSAWCQDHTGSPKPHATSPLPSPTNSSVYSGYFQRSPSPEQHKRPMDSDRSSTSSWRWNNKDNSR
ncbi:hypothetical protein GE21DRAFT_7902 [Neurospora crassa]|uniref:Uncharacterized protein n=2 Tax=Neurospora TaxID=5140 RepID=A7UWV3_NEUCR|nr:hypothetical protein NCU11338 [Neurospora crassa OR74A]EDO65087.2 hypothetical protein NCU11338 [Neurospora crassa OR74A]KHE86948.1 hypothetical protein GE21DRAFT_7902 [Neurospora crassa]|eukprot:XP_001728178.2 hypothetical protein NCU11338 [Neurospora crassa OR74A]